MSRDLLKPCPFTPESRRLTKKSWEAMVARCTNPKHPHLADYAGRGISIVGPWLAFARFCEDVGPRPSRDHFLDRIDNDGNYEPGNVRWATRTEQHRNKRNNRHVTAFGETLTLAGWAEKSGIGRTTIRCRLEAGWNAEEAVSAAPSSDPHRRLSAERRREIIDAAHQARYGHAPNR